MRKTKSKRNLEPEPRIRKIRSPKIKTPFAKAILGEFKKLLLKCKGELVATVGQMEKESLSSSLKEASGNLSNMPIHLADMGTDQYEQDFTIGVVEGERGEIAEINEALQRIVDKTYGVCELCLKRITTPRLKAVPYTRLCIKCKEEEEKKHSARS